MSAWLIIFAVLGSVLAQNSRRVELSQGPVVGFRTGDADVFSFYGIPYATAPTGRDKFKGPLPAPNWTEPLEATDKLTICPQFQTAFFPNHIQKEDCLILNVFVPNTDETNLPVVVHIHGGGFLVGHSNWEVPTQFVESKKVIAVTLNYRLGPHGFLCMGTEGIPGNAGIKDQVAALRWVKANIASFGGDPEEITIAGCSAGGGSVDLHILPKMSQGLFKRVIGQGGANIASFVVQVDPMENANYYANQINFPGGDINALEEFYRTITFDQLLSYNLLSNKDHAVKMSPCIERDLGIEMFLDNGPKNIIKSGNYTKYPMIYGFAQMEGLFRLDEFKTWKDEMNRDFSQFIPADLQFESQAEKEQVAQEIKYFYFGDKTVSDETIIEYLNFVGDAIFIYPMQKAVTLQVEAGNNEIYLHVYSFTDENTPYIPNTSQRGADHCSQNLAVFDADYSSLTLEYKQMKEDIRTIWYDFMTTGNPTPAESRIPKWEPARAERAPIMNLGRQIRLESTFEKERTDFWERIYDKHYRYPVAPSSSSTGYGNPLLGFALLFLMRFASTLQ